MMTPDSSIGIGNELNRILQNAFGTAFVQGELAQLTHSSYENSVVGIDSSKEETITIKYPIGYRADKQPMISEKQYNKEELKERFQYLAHIVLPTNGIYQLTMIIETMLGDLIRRIVSEYPDKLSPKRQIALKDILNANSVQEIHMKVTDKLLNELSYKSPREFAEEAKIFLSINLLECTAYHSYIEMKATRDVYIHNKGIVNETYVTKAGSHARASEGQELPITQIYFLEVYESCLQLLEWLEVKLHGTWRSSEYEGRKKTS